MQSRTRTILILCISAVAFPLSIKVVSQLISKTNKLDNQAASLKENKKGKAAALSRETR